MVRLRARCWRARASPSSLEEVRGGSGDETAQAALRVSTELLGLVPVVSRSPLQALARLRLPWPARGRSRTTKSGRPRGEEAAERVQGVARLLTATTEAPALLVAAMVHAELLTGAPFASHNGIVARAAERLVLAAGGVNEKSLVVPEAGHLANRAAYETNLQGYAAGGRSGVHAWALYAAGGVRRRERGGQSAA